MRESKRYSAQATSRDCAQGIPKGIAKGKRPSRTTGPLGKWTHQRATGERVAFEDMTEEVETSILDLPDRTSTGTGSRAPTVKWNGADGTCYEVKRMFSGGFMLKCYAPRGLKWMCKLRLE